MLAFVSDRSAASLVAGDYQSKGQVYRDPEKGG